MLWNRIWALTRQLPKKCIQRLLEYKKKFMQFGWFAAAILFYKVLNETSQLSLYMESDSVLIYQLSSEIKETFQFPRNFAGRRLRIFAI